MKKTIRKIFRIAEKAIISTNSLFAHKSDIFKPTADFTASKLEYDFDYDTEKQEIKLDDFQGKDFLITVQYGKSYNSKFSKTWDFQLCDEKIAPFQFNEYYPIAKNGAIWIYTKQTVKASSLQEGGQTITTYFLAEVAAKVEISLN